MSDIHRPSGEQSIVAVFHHQRKESYLKDCNETQGLIYRISLETLQDIIDIVEPMSGESWFEVYLTRF